MKFFNFIDKKKNASLVKENIEKEIENAKAIINIVPPENDN